MKSVTFHLHKSYDKASQVVNEPPYTVSESGWGEFEAVIELQFKKSFTTATNIKIFYYLRLFPTYKHLLKKDDLHKFTIRDQLIVKHPSEQLIKWYTTYFPASYTDPTTNSIGVNLDISPCLQTSTPTKGKKKNRFLFEALLREKVVQARKLAMDETRLLKDHLLRTLNSMKDISNSKLNNLDQYLLRCSNVNIKTIEKRPRRVLSKTIKCRKSKTTNELNGSAQLSVIATNSSMSQDEDTSIKSDDSADEDYAPLNHTN